MVARSNIQDNVLTLMVTDKHKNGWEGDIVMITERTGRLTFRYTHWLDDGLNKPVWIFDGVKDCILIADPSPTRCRAETEIFMIGDKSRGYGDEIFQKDNLHHAAK